MFKNAQMGAVTQIIRYYNLDEVDENKFISALIYTIKANNEDVVAKLLAAIVLVRYLLLILL